MHNRFSEASKMLLIDFINKHYDKPLFTDGEAIVRTYIALKRQNNLHELIFRNNEIDFQNKWVNVLLDDFVTGHEGKWGGSDTQNLKQVVNALQNSNSLYLLFEDHYSYDENSLL
ncbi:hypothetical protein LB465_17650 [Salegentibacter sp. LM13S]|uniref:hypothetical protein n=1 Tax=Salegentibacter lacus TaxID=2873599 RepID=UPI001CCF5B31|nr:hypothetical protein [Salegentibacter lacus]MBZ9632607.1 hypothetical protein [Salegentibacter lacus]